MMFIGESCALISAFLWAIVAVYYKKLGEILFPQGMNIGKGTVALLCFGFLCILDNTRVSVNGFIWLMLSGILGIGLGDTYFFRALSKLGPRVSVLSTILIPVLTVILSAFILGERVSVLKITGFLITLGGVVYVMAEKMYARGRPISLRKGLSDAAISIGCCSCAIVFSKIALVSSGVSVYKAVFIRQVGGLVVLIVWGLTHKKLRVWIYPIVRDFHAVGKELCYTAFLGAFLGTLFSLYALQYTSASIATMLNSTSPLFIVGITFLFYKERVTLPVAIATLAACLGVVLIFL